MKIVDLVVDDFGTLYDYRAEGLSDTLNLFYGPNEAGKSTLKDFIIASLFSLPKANSPGYHQALHGGVHGGRIKLQDDRGTIFTIEGFKKRILRNSDNKEIEIASISQILGGVDRDLFSHVFAFGLKELANLELITTGQISEFLFNTATFGDGASITKLTEELDKRLNNLYSPRARKDPAPINETLATIKNLNKELQSARRRQDKSIDIQEEIKRIDTQIAELKKQENALKKHIAKLEVFDSLKTKTNLQNLYREISSFIEKTGYYASILPLSQEIEYLYVNKEKYLSDIARLDEIEAKIEDKLSGMSRLQHELEQIQTDLAQGPRTTDIKNVELHMANFKSDTSKIDGWENTREGLQQDIVTAEKKYTNIAQNIQINIIPEYLDKVTITNLLKYLFFVEELPLATDNVTDFVDRCLSDPENRQTYLNNFIKICDQWRRDIQQLKIKIEERERIDNNLIAFQSEYERIATIYNQRTTQPRNALLLLIISTILSLAAFLLAFSKHNILETALVFSAFLATSCGLYLWYLAEKKRILPSKSLEKQDSTGTTPDTPSHLAELEKLIETKIEERGILEKEISTLERTTHVGTTSKAKLEGLQQHIEPIYQSISDLQKLVDDINAKKDTDEDLNHKIVNTKKQLEEKKQSLHSIYHRYGIPDNINLELLPDILRQLEQLLTEKKEYEELTKNKELLAASIQNFEPTLDKVTSKILSIFDEEDIANPDLLQLDISDKYGELFKKGNTVQQSFQDFVASHKNMKELVIQIRTNVNFFRMGNHHNHSAVVTKIVEGLMSLHSTANNWEKIQESIEYNLKEIEQTIQMDLQSVQSSEAEYSEYLEYSDNTKENLKIQLQQIEVEKEDGQRRRGQSENELKSLLSSQEIADLEFQLENQKTRLEDLLRQYLTYSFTNWTITSTLRRYEEEKQPDILKRAGELISLVTDNRYSKVFATTGSRQEKSLKISDGDKTFSAENLSQGTKEQLYLCLRIAYAENFARYGKNLPFIFDDILVNFDLTRAKQAVKLVTETSLKRQVIAFTCHDYIKDLFLEASSECGIKVFTLPSGA